MTTPRVVAFCHAAYPDRVDMAIDLADDPVDQHTKMEMIEAHDRDREWWGPDGDPGGTVLRVEQGPEGPYALLAGRRVPALIDGDVVRLGIPARVGYCAAWALTACERLIEDETTEVALVFGRGYSNQQAWVEFPDAQGRWWVLDLTLSGAPFDRDAYYAALHARAGTRIPIPDRATLDAFREATKSVDPWDVPRDEFMARLAPRERQKKE